ncbi:MAG: hypothetical protein R3190_09220 [Thermoanaerobaculia bacterium]|nr:hypothetical protein [Thermoanaerobaculia bacterium]
MTAATRIITAAGLALALAAAPLVADNGKGKGGGNGGGNNGGNDGELRSWTIEIIGDIEAGPVTVSQVLQPADYKINGSEALEGDVYNADIQTSCPGNPVAHFTSSAGQWFLGDGENNNGPGMVLHYRATDGYSYKFILRADPDTFPGYPLRADGTEDWPPTENVVTNAWTSWVHGGGPNGKKNQCSAEGTFAAGVIITPVANP